MSERQRAVRAAGGVGWRSRGDAVEVVLVHRPRYDDWSLPKGKLSKREHPLLGAVREVFEETSVHAVPQVRLPSTRYLTGEPGVEKVVDYWSMRFARQEGFTPGEEVDDARWFPVAEAAKTLTYGHDRGVQPARADPAPDGRGDRHQRQRPVRHAQGHRLGPAVQPNRADQRRPAGSARHVIVHIRRRAPGCGRPSWSLRVSACAPEPCWPGRSWPRPSWSCAHRWPLRHGWP